MAEDQETNEQSPGGFKSKPVDTRAIIAIAGYLLIITLLIFYGLFENWPKCGPPSSAMTATANQVSNANVNRNASANVNTNANTNQTVNNSGSLNTNGSVDNSNRNTNTSTNRATGIKVLSVSPASGLVDRNTLVTIKGSGFKPGARVTFGGVAVEVIEPVVDDAITVETQPHHTAGKVDVSVRNNDGEVGLLADAYTFTCPAPPDSRLLLIVILAGALGGSIHALRSLFWYVGNRELVWSWVLMYIVLPFIGAAIAVVFFIIVRGGFMDPPKDKETTLYLFALAVLTGLFSEQAALKLANIANAIFTKPEEGKDSKPQGSESVGATGRPKPGSPSLGKINPNKGPIAGGQDIKITDTGLTSVKSVTFGGKAASDIRFDNTTSAIEGKTPPGTKGEVDVIITDNNDKTVKLKYTYE